MFLFHSFAVGATSIYGGLFMLLEHCQPQSLERPTYGFWQHVGRLLQHLGQRIERYSQLAHQRQQLLEMDDRLLKDIGLSRADVDRIAGRRRYWDDPLISGEQTDQRYRRHANDELER